MQMSSISLTWCYLEGIREIDEPRPVENPAEIPAAVRLGQVGQSENEASGRSGTLRRYVKFWAGRIGAEDGPAIFEPRDLRSGIAFRPAPEAHGVADRLDDWIGLHVIFLREVRRFWKEKHIWLNRLTIMENIGKHGLTPLCEGISGQTWNAAPLMKS